MSWLTRKLDMLVAAVLSTAAGMAASQTQTFIQQYLQRLGGHLDEARLNFQAVRDSADPVVGPTLESLAPVLERLQARIDGLEVGFRAIAEADVWSRPLVFLQHVDRPIAEGTAALFQPALPLGTDGLVFTLAGILLALVAWELVKLPFALLSLAAAGNDRKKKRIFDARGGPLT
jgi:hypothetical protein